MVTVIVSFLEDCWWSCEVQCVDCSCRQAVAREVRSGVREEGAVLGCRVLLMSLPRTRAAEKAQERGSVAQQLNPPPAPACRVHLQSAGPTSTHVTKSSKVVECCSSSARSRLLGQKQLYWQLCGIWRIATHQTKELDWLDLAKVEAFEHHLRFLCLPDGLRYDGKTLLTSLPWNTAGLVRPASFRVSKCLLDGQLNGTSTAIVHPRQRQPRVG